MQKRVANVIRALAESDDNPIVSIHDHGAGGHLNALSELVEETGGVINIDALPVGDKTLSAREIIGNESQERMGLVVKEQDIDRIRAIADRERAPFYVVGETTGDNRFVFRGKDENPIDLDMADMFGNSPKTVITDSTVDRKYANPQLDADKFVDYLKDVLSLEAVACKDWLTNKVDRSVTGRVARQQCQGEIQLPVSDCGVVALDYNGRAGIATSIGHAPQAALADSRAGSVLSIAEALTNIVGANLADGLKSISLSANWMWPCKNAGQDAALYEAVEACSKFAIDLGINIPTGKDSLSMTQKYGDEKVMAPGTVIISAAGEVADVRLTVPTAITPKLNTTLYYIPFTLDPLSLGGSALYQSLGAIGSEVPAVSDTARFARTFAAIQQLVAERRLLAMHDVSAGGLATTLLEMMFPTASGGLGVSLDELAAELDCYDMLKLMFAENPAVVVQVDDRDIKHMARILKEADIPYAPIAVTAQQRIMVVGLEDREYLMSIDNLRDTWFAPSARLDALQSGEKCAALRRDNYSRQPLRYAIPAAFDGSLKSRSLSLRRDTATGLRAAIIREKGVNGDREMAMSLYLAGFDVRDVHMTDLASGRETLDDINMLVFCGGFSNSDVLGSAKGWAAGFKWNERAAETLRRYYSRPDTLSLGVCNGCQLMIELGLINPAMEGKAHMAHNISGKFESQFLGVKIPANNSVMFGSLSGMKLGIWVAHGEGRFELPADTSLYNVVACYNYASYPGNPNGSRGAVAAIASPDGRHLAMMPHLERAIFPWQCAHYPRNRRNDDVTPWLDAFVNAARWITAHKA
jgi:phosphoribosylformylglycinamidine synthase